jgi:putative selenate reductase
MRLVRDHKTAEAVAVTLGDNPLAAILGRACHHPCERPCSRSHLDDPLAIREIKRFIMHHEKSPPELGAQAERAVRVAIVGAGPCGLSAASFLARVGVLVTVFEARPASGGMVSATIPGYRATQRAVDQDLVRLEALGVEIRHGHRIGPESGLQDLRDHGFHHLVVAGGAQLGLALGIPGERSRGVWDGLEFLRAARTGSLGPPGARVAVIGGGDAAMDCARTARRLGSDAVTVLYRRTVNEMPAQAEELRGLMEEGIAVEELVSPRAVVADGGRMVALRCVRNSLGDPDSSGRRRPVEVPGSEFELPLECLIVAIGQRADLALFGDLPVAANDAGYLVVDPFSLETSITGIFAGGDMIGDGPATIVKACGDGRRIASTILSREGISSPPSDPIPPAVSRAELVEILRRRSCRRFRVDVPELPPAERADFEEVVQNLSPESAAAEAERCLDCDLLCSNCEWVCPNRAFLSYRVQPTSLGRRESGGRQTEAAGEQYEPFAVEQFIQVAVLADLCNECGNCTTFCPTLGEPFRDKPRLYLSRADFEAESDNAFMVAGGDSRWVIQGRFGGSLHEIVVADDRVRYATGTLRLELDPESLSLIHTETVGDRTTTDTPRECAAMWVLLTGIKDSQPWLPVAAIDELDLMQSDLL